MYNFGWNNSRIIYILPSRISLLVAPDQKSRKVETNMLKQKCALSRTGSVVFALAFLFMSSLMSWGTFLEELAKPKEGRSMRATSAHRVDQKWDSPMTAEFDANSNWDQKSVPAGGTKVLMDEKGPGVITHIWMTFLGPEPQGWAKKGSANHQELLLRIYYDGSERPGVEAPVGDFFANSFGKRSEVISMPVVVEDADSYNCFWRMPFRKSIRVEIINQSDKRLSMLYYNIDWIKQKKMSRKAPYFYAQYRQEYPTVSGKGKDYTILETQGKGHLVGVVLSVRTRSPSWFGEGDEKIYIDGEEKASIWGTGTEDYFLSAWGLKTTSTPYFGTPYFDQWGIVGGHTSAYRWHINDPIVFNKSIKVDIEHMGWMSDDEKAPGDRDSWSVREDDYSSVAFWYQTGIPTFTARAPHAKERKLASLDQIFYAASFTGRDYHGAGTIRSQEILNYPEGHLLYKPRRADESGWVEIPFEVKKKEPVRLLLNMTRANDFGKYQAYLNGVKIGGVMNFYHEDINTWEYHLLDFWPKPGKYSLRLECVGKSDVSSGYGVAIESIRLRERRPRVSQWARDKDKDWRDKQILYR
jgi:D-arabinan exo alpha-(1,3)/(1,5)-arabinofuranosidase (non-reducing end)